ncbi:MAG: uncharacterized protein K0R38_6187 [Polyangiaceae bacterium]|nr:uncharacterized protein [Polyangiaceae bacterium]
MTVRTPPELQQIRDALASVPGVKLALVFGSVARGQAREGSDVDVAVLGADLDVAELSARISEATGREAQVVRLEDATIPLLEELLSDGIVVSDPEARAAVWRSHALADMELDRPWWRRQRDAWLAREAGKGAP